MKLTGSHFPIQGVESRPLLVKVQSPNRWTARGFSEFNRLDYICKHYHKIEKNLNLDICTFGLFT